MLGSHLLLASLAFVLAQGSALPEAKLLQVDRRQINPPVVTRNCNTPTDRACWMNGSQGQFDANTDSATRWPNTGKEVKYDLHVSEKTLAPDGNSKKMLVIDGKYPGTLIRARKSNLPPQYGFH